VQLGLRPYIEREAHQRVELVLAYRDIQRAHHAHHGLLRVTHKPKIGLGLGACQALEHLGAGVPPPDGPNTPLVLIGAQPALLEGFDDRDAGAPELHFFDLSAMTPA
jgi:hypothetical protein